MRSITLQKPSVEVVLSKGANTITLAPKSQSAIFNKISNNVALSSSSIDISLVRVEDTLEIESLSADTPKVDLNTTENPISLLRESNPINLAITDNLIELQRQYNSLNLNVEAVIQPGGTSNRVVLANCTATDSQGDLVYVTGPRIGVYYQVEKIDITDKNKMPTWGIIIEKLSITECKVQWLGEIYGVYTGLTPGAIYYAGLFGIPTSIRPTSNYIQTIGLAISTDILLFIPEFDIHGAIKKNVELVGVKDGINRIFMTPDTFLPESFSAFHNGRRLKQASGITPDLGEYFITESSGPGTGYDMLVFTAFVPIHKSVLHAEYICSF